MSEEYKILIGMQIPLNSVQFSVTNPVTYIQEHVVGHLINIFIKQIKYDFYRSN